MRELERIILVTTLGTVFASVSSTARSDATGVPTREERLPGSRLSVQEALDRSHLVVVAKVIDVRILPILSGMSTRYEMTAKVVESLEGDAHGDLSVSIRIPIIFPADERERVPETGRDYVLFLDRKIRSISAVKFACPSESMLQRIKGLLGEAPLPGSDSTVRRAAEYADLVAVARVLQVVEGGPGEPGRAPYHAKIRIARTLKGQANGEHFVYLVVQVAPNGEPEAIPEVGQDYVFFIGRRPGAEMVAMKLARPTEELLRRVKDILEELAEDGG